MKHVLGIDGGATRTRAAVADATGQIIGAGEAGPGNYHSVGLDVVRANLAAAVAAAWRAARLAAQPAAAATVGLAGLAAADDVVRLQAVITELRLADPARTLVCHDLHLAWAGGLAGAPGVVVIAGTGAAAYGVNAGGASWKAGGWGYLIDDRGGGYQLALAGLAAVARAADGRGPATALTPALLAALDAKEPRDIVRRLHQDKLSHADLAGRGALVAETAAQGDAVAGAIMDAAAAELALAVAAVVARLEFAAGAVAVTWAGSLLERGADYRARLAAALARQCPRAALAPPVGAPVTGAVLLAARALA